MGTCKLHERESSAQRRVKEKGKTSWAQLRLSLKIGRRKQETRYKICMYKSKSYATNFDALAHTKYVCVLHSFASCTHTNTHVHSTNCVQHNKDAKHKEERGGGRQAGELGHCHKWRWRFGDAVVDWHKASVDDDVDESCALLSNSFPPSPSASPSLSMSLSPSVAASAISGRLSNKLATLKCCSEMNANVCIADNDQVPSISNRTFWHWDRGFAASNPNATTTWIALDFYEVCFV